MIILLVMTGKKREKKKYIFCISQKGEGKKNAYSE
jgi:hypothetical protein